VSGNICNRGGDVSPQQWYTSANQQHWPPKPLYL